MFKQIVIFSSLLLLTSGFSSKRRDEAKPLKDGVDPQQFFEDLFKDFPEVIGTGIPASNIPPLDPYKSNYSVTFVDIPNTAVDAYVIFVDDMTLTGTSDLSLSTPTVTIQPWNETYVNIDGVTGPVQISGHYSMTGYMNQTWIGNVANGTFVVGGPSYQRKGVYHFANASFNADYTLVFSGDDRGVLSEGAMEFVGLPDDIQTLFDEIGDDAVQEVFYYLWNSYVFSGEFDLLHEYTVIFQNPTGH